MSIERTTTQESNELIPWSDIESSLAGLIPAERGNSSAQRGIIHMNEGGWLFVKIGASDNTRRWATKEIKSYEFLKENGYAYVPRVLAVKPDQTGFAIEALLPEDGWDWSDAWNEERLTATLNAMDDLAKITPDSRYSELLKPVVTDADNGWAALTASPERQSYLAAKLEAISERGIMPRLQEHAERSLQYHVRHDSLVHDDVRADNCAWNRHTGQVKLIDWNWLELGDRRIDLAGFLVHVQQSGLDVLATHADRLDAEALHWMAGFWFEAASEPIWPGGPEKLRETQLRGALTAFRLAQERTK